MRHEHGDPIQRMNRDHADQVLTIARVLAGHPDATSAHIELVDPRGVDLCVETPTGPTTARVDFAEPLPPDDRPENIRVAFVRLARRARNESSIE